MTANHRAVKYNWDSLLDQMGWPSSGPGLYPFIESMVDLRNEFCYTDVSVGVDDLVLAGLRGWFTGKR